MKPALINVFDGLRVTTQHIDHLQGSFHSAVRDIRGILGEGKIHQGFGVAKEGPKTVTVSPGLAFDFNRNRIALDRPKSLDIGWEKPGDTEKTICIKYKQVEDELVEEVPTIIWESCAVELCAAFPPEGLDEPPKNMIPIARLTRKKDETDAPVDDFDLTPLPLPDTAETGTGDDKEEKEEKEKIEDKKEKPGESFSVRQGILRLPGDAPGTADIGTLTIEPLKKVLGSPPPSMVFKLGEKEIPAGSTCISLSCHTIVDISLSQPASGDEANGGSAPKELGRAQATAQGEVTFPPGKINRFGMSTLRFYPGAGQPHQTLSALTPDGIAHLPMTPGTETQHPVLDRLRLLVTINNKNSSGYKACCALQWDGKEAGKMIASLNQNKIEIKWQVVLGWKALANPVLQDNKNNKMK